MRKNKMIRRSVKMFGFAVIALLPLRLEAAVFTWDAGTSGGNC